MMATKCDVQHARQRFCHTLPQRNLFFHEHFLSPPTALACHALSSAQVIIPTSSCDGSHYRFVKAWHVPFTSDRNALNIDITMHCGRPYLESLNVQELNFS